MHWLPLVAMVIASALPFPHNPVSRIVAATPERGADDRREHDAASRRSALAVDNDANAIAVAVAGTKHDDGLDLQDREDYVKSSTHEETSTFRLENQGHLNPKSDSGSDGASSSSIRLDVPAEVQPLGTEDKSEDNSLPTENTADGSSSSGRGPSQIVSTVRDWSRNPPLQVSAAESHNPISLGATQTGPRGPEPTVAAGQQRETAGTQRTDRGAGAGPSEESVTLEAKLGPGLGWDNILEGDEMLLDAHPRVLLSPSRYPPEDPPLLLMLESGLLEEDGDEEEQGIVRNTTPSWADSPKVTREVAYPIKRDKRSHLIDRRRGEKSVCESESVWVTDKKSAIDSHGQKVTILQEIQTQTGPLKQYFYETRCRQAEQPSRSRGPGLAPRSPGMGVAGAGCLGVDKKQWLSECKAKQSFVRALTRDANNRTGWRWIRIDSSCVCVLLSRANQAPGREVLTSRGRG